MLSEFSVVFSGKLGKVKDHIAVIYMLDIVMKKMCKAHCVPFALQQTVENELTRLEKDGILQRVDTNTLVTCASPTMNVVKKQTSCVIICGDYKVTINPFMITDHYLLSTFGEIIARLNGGEEFTVIVLKDAWLQFEVNEASQQCYFGHCNSPGLFKVFTHAIWHLFRSSIW